MKRLIVPRSINLEITNACNLSCIYCYRLSNMKVKEMEFSLFKTIVDQTKVFSPISFSLHKFGEPTMNKNILDYICYIKSVNRNNHIYLTTNGLLLNRYLSKELLKWGVDHINFSIGALRQNTYSKLHKGGDLKIVERNLKELVRLRQRYKSDTYITAQIIKMDETEGEIEGFVKKWKGYGVIPEVWSKVTMDDKNPISYANHLKKKYPCALLWTNMVVDSDGKVSLCVCDYKSSIIIGDTNKEKILDIWNGDEIKKYRKFHLEDNYNKISLCEKCDYNMENYNLFSGEIIKDIFLNCSKV